MKHLLIKFKEDSYFNQEFIPSLPEGFPASPIKKLGDLKHGDKWHILRANTSGMQTMCGIHSYGNIYQGHEYGTTLTDRVDCPECLAQLDEAPEAPCEASAERGRKRAKIKGVKIAFCKLGNTFTKAPAEHVDLLGTRDQKMLAEANKNACLYVRAEELENWTNVLPHLSNVERLTIELGGPLEFKGLPPNLKRLEISFQKDVYCDSLDFLGPFPESLEYLSVSALHLDESPYVGATLPGRLGELVCRNICVDADLPDSLLSMSLVGIKRSNYDTFDQDMRVIPDWVYKKLDSVGAEGDVFLRVDPQTGEIRVRSPYVPKFGTNLKRLEISHCTIDGLAPFPEGLEELSVRGCKMHWKADFPPLPKSLLGLVFGSSHIGIEKVRVPKLPEGLLRLDVSNNSALGSLPELPSTLLSLDCSNTGLGKLPELPEGLVSLNCSNSCVAELPALPRTLAELACNGTELPGLPKLPEGLRTLCAPVRASADALPDLPDTLQVLELESVSGGEMCKFPPNLVRLQLTDIRLDNLSGLPSSLNYLSLCKGGVHRLGELPSGLVGLMLVDVQMPKLTSLPEGLRALNCTKVAFKEAAKLPSLPASLKYFDCTDTQLEEFPTVPKSVEVFFTDTRTASKHPDAKKALDRLSIRATGRGEAELSQDRLLLHGENAERVFAELDKFPEFVKKLSVSEAKLTDIPELPEGLEELELVKCSDCAQFFSRPLPKGLKKLRLSGTWTDGLSKLPSGLVSFFCMNGGTTVLPELPEGLETLYLGYGTLLETLVPLPASLKTLQLVRNGLCSKLPDLPEGLEHFECAGNHIPELPALPASLRSLVISDVGISELPPLPAGLVELKCSGTNIKAVPSLSAGVKTLVWNN